MRILFLGDVMGRAGRAAVVEHLRADLVAARPVADDLAAVHLVADDLAAVHLVADRRESSGP